MSDEASRKKSLSEISHLFLSSVRENTSAGPRPRRVPPASPRAEVSMDLTPEEFAQVFDSTASSSNHKEKVAPVSAVIASHLNGRQLDRVKEYARHLAAGGKRIGLIEVDTAEFRVMCFDRTAELLEPTSPLETNDPRQMAECLDELACDIDHWLLLLPNPRSAEARNLLRSASHWTLLSTCDHDGVVSCYRAIKGLADDQHPRLSLALLDATDQEEAGRVYRKVANVCQQFLNWTMEAEPAVEPADEVSEHLVLLYRPSRDRAAVAPSPHWQIVADFLERAASSEAASDNTSTAPETPAVAAPASPEPKIMAEIPSPASPSLRIHEPAPSPFADNNQSDESEILDLPTAETSEAAVLGAVVRKASLGLVECPVRPPTCPQAMLAVNRDRRLVLLALTRQGMPELRSIGQAYRWVIENRPLLAMALPQFSIDVHSMPGLQLLVDRADVSADVLQPMLQSGNVSVQTYRKLRWGGKTGLLLEAA